MSYYVKLLKELSNKINYIDIRGFTTLVSRHIVRSDFIVFSDISTPNENTILYNGEEVSTQANKNLGNRYIFGCSLQGNWMLSDPFEISGGITYNSADQNPDYGPMPSIAPLFGTLILSNEVKKLKTLLIWKFSKRKFPTDYSWGGEDGLNETPIVNPDSPLLINKYYGMPSWSTLSIMSQYKFGKFIVLNIGLKNIFDLHYRTFASGISAEGRSLQLGLKVKI